jgi:NodT family efflux transporter outer membrane factor (OMF) lipoprotein
MNRMKQNTRASQAALAGLLGGLALLGGCHVGPAFHAPAPPAIASANYKESTVNFHDADGWKVASPQDAMLRGKWWEAFNEPELNALEEQLLVDNQNIKASFQSFMEARAVVSEARAQYWPTVTFGPSWSRSRSSASLSNSSSSSGQASSLWAAPIDVSWTPDFWGKIRNEVHEAQYAAQVSAADLENEKLTEQAALAEYFFEIRGEDQIQKILDQAVEVDKKTLDAAQGAYDSGTGDQLAVVQARQTLQSAEAAAINIGLARGQYEHAVAMLLGKPATDFSIPVKAAVYSAPAIPTGVPAQLIERRPDIAAQERTLAEANAAIGIGYGAFFPQVTLSASGGLESSKLSKLFSSPSRVWSIGPSISQTVFDGGLYRAELHQYVATYNADVANYRQTILTAFQQVEDDLLATRVYSQQINRQKEVVDSAKQSVELEKQRYDAGVDPLADVLSEQNTLLSSQETLVSLQVEEMLSSVQLIQALGGGWDRSQLPTPQQMSVKQPRNTYTLQK